MDLWVLAATAGGIFFLAAFGQAITGFGFSIMAMPFLVLVLQPRAAIVAATIVGMVLALGAVWGYRRSVDWPCVRLLVLASLLGLPVGFLVLVVIEASVLKVGIAVMVLVAVVLVSSGLRVPDGRLSTATAGVSSGLLQSATGMGGPPLVLALQGRGLSPLVFRSSIMATSLLQGSIALGGFLLLGYVDRFALTAIAGGLVCGPAGWLLGNKVFVRISPERFRRVVLAALAGTAVVSLVAAFAG